MLIGSRTDSSLSNTSNGGFVNNEDRTKRECRVTTIILLLYHRGLSYNRVIAGRFRSCDEPWHKPHYNLKGVIPWHKPNP